MSRIRALVVDDAIFMRRMLTAVLQSDDGVEVVATAPDGETALNLIRELNPDIVTLDLEMPGLGGMGTLGRIGAFWPDLPVIVVSGADVTGSRVAQLAVAAGAIDYVTKPSHMANAEDALQHFRRALLPRIRTVTAALHRRRVLVADDGNVNRALLGRMLRTLHCDVTDAVDGGDAVEKAAAAAFDVVFMDSEMPRLDGCEATRRIRQLPGGQAGQCFIVGISASDGETVRSSCLAAGMDDFMFKPFSQNFVRLMVSRSLQTPGLAAA